MRNNLFAFAPWLLLLFHHTHWDQTEESLCRSLGSGPTLEKGCSALAPLLFGATVHCLSVQPPWLPPWLPPWKTFQNIPFGLGLFAVDTSVPNGLLMLQNSFHDFIFEHWSGCYTTEPGYAGDIGLIEIWFYWLNITIGIILVKPQNHVLIFIFFQIIQSWQ